LNDRSIIGEVFFVKIVFFEKRNDRTRFELIRKGKRGDIKLYDVSQGRYECRYALFEERCRNGIKIRERVR